MLTLLVGLDLCQGGETFTSYMSLLDCYTVNGKSVLASIIVFTK